MPINTKRAGLGGLFGGLAEGIWKGLATIETQKRTKILEDEEARRKAESETLIETKKDELIAKQQAGQLAMLKEKVELKRAENAENELKLKNLEFSYKYMPDAITPLQFEKIQGEAKNDGFDPNMFYSPEKDEKTGVIKQYTRSDPESVKKRFDAAASEIKLKNEQIDKAIKTLDLELTKKKLEGGGPVPATAEAAMIDQMYKDPKFLSLTFDERQEAIAKSKWKLPTSSTVIKTMEPGSKQQLEKDNYNTIKQLGDLGIIADTYMKDFSTWPGQIKGWAIDKILKAGETVENIFNLSDESREYARKFARFNGAVTRTHNKYVNDVSGAAFSIQEMDRYEKAMFNSTQNYEAFSVAFKDYTDHIKKSYRLRNMAIEKGFTGEDIGKEIDKLNSLPTDPSMDKNIQTRRGGELVKMYLSKKKKDGSDISLHEARDLATFQLHEEGYL